MDQRVVQAAVIGFLAGCVLTYIGLQASLKTDCHVYAEANCSQLEESQQAFCVAQMRGLCARR